MRLRDDPRPMIYVPFEQHLSDYAGTGPFYLHARMDFAIRTELADPAAVTRAVRQIVTDVDSSVAVDKVIDARASLRLGGERTFLPCLLGPSEGSPCFRDRGIYGVIADAEQRPRIQHPTAMGAGRRDILSLSAKV
jgi:hypothetical protein